MILFALAPLAALFVSAIAINLKDHNCALGVGFTTAIEGEN